ncbi:MAG: DEAD/DEAH box helicase [Thermoplasmata archaeon]|nr:DEAD/DEAH box helicase [Thermoplasmata archaeon]
MHDDDIRSGLDHGFVRRSPDALEDFSPRLLLNDPARNLSVITSLKGEMDSCDEFMFSVAFVTYDAVNALIQIFEELEEAGIRGRILASTYQNFTDPKALERLSGFSNLDVRVVTDDVAAMHAKCYIFRRGDVIDVIIGSSNLTVRALKSNMEWNLKVSSTESGDVISALLAEFESAFSHATKVDPEWLDAYRSVYRPISGIVGRPVHPGASDRPSPNSMQVRGLESLRRIHDSRAPRALVVSATGTGKTYLSAFDARWYKAENPGARFLYLVHRTMVLEKSMESFRRVLGDVPISRFDPNDASTRRADFLFATVQSMSRPEVLGSFDPEAFDYIIVDETHHAGAASYERIIDHFRPEFLLGMTATPDTRGYDIYSIFDHNIAFNIRLRQAMEADLICPFHYFGVDSVEIGEEILDSGDFSRIEFEQRVDLVASKARLYGYSGDRVRGLGFCRRVSEAEAYAAAFRARGFRAEAASGSTGAEEREELVRRLSAGSGDCLDYVFTADLFNEGVDIPPVNQILMLRPTESPVIFIQQLGRGLRLCSGKEFVVVIDFIGNYAKNYNIPIALSDDFAYRKSDIRRFVHAGDGILPGMSTVSFDRISKERIYRSIDAGNFTARELLADEYRKVRTALGRIPELVEFDEFGSMDAMNFLSAYGTYHRCLKALDRTYEGVLDDSEIAILTYATDAVASGKRVLEALLLRGVLEGKCPLEHMMSELGRMGIEPDMKDVGSAVRVMNGAFHSDRSGKRKRDVDLVGEDGRRIPERTAEALENPVLRDHLRQVADLGMANWTRDYGVPGGFVLYRQYSREDVARLLDWPYNVNGQTIGGYFHERTTDTLPVFVNYEKTDSVAESQRYHDHFINRKYLEVESKPKRTESSPDMRAIRDSEANGTRIELFMRKSADDKGPNEFYYLGRMRFDRFVGRNDDRDTMVYRFALDRDVPEDLYGYFTASLPGSD